MENGKSGMRLRTAMFGGFRKDDVLEYLKEFDANAMAQIAERDGKIEAQKNEIFRLGAQISDFERQEICLNQERDLIADTLVTAKQTANKIVTDAKVEASKRQAEMQQNYSIEINKLATIRNEIVQLRKFATDAIRNFERELASIERSTIN